MKEKDIKKVVQHMSSFLAKANGIVIKQIEEKIKELQEELDNM